ncbi:hypothetical protein [Sphingosinicella sp. CPCC 101087]|uniref:hypothetical protein n=1 Tax=Sphingosinicella sp. CPCC 101087 TaxID=2497754 RepID=UPI00101B87F3|nr:hypothetical protein [Sphingosinicella sp. CPCC 101087]
MNKLFASAAVGLALASAAFTAPPAEARQRQHNVTAHGPHGRSYTRSRSVAREPGSVAVSRSLQTAGGRGHASSRHASWGDGRYSGGASHVLNDGRAFGRSTSITNNGDGSYSYARTRTGPNGGSRSRSGTVTLPPR